MRWINPLIISAAVLLAVKFITVVVSQEATPATSFRPKDVTMAYSCGYLDGISHAPIAPPKHLDWCDEYTKTAHENGFNP